MRRLLPLLLSALMLLSLTACGQQGGSPSASQGSAGSTAASSSEPDPTPVPEPYVISDPKVMPEGGGKDGVPYVAWDGIVEHLFFHPVVAYPELAFDGDS